MTLFQNLENYYIQKIDFIENSDYRENVKVNELENIEQMAGFYHLDYAELLAREAIERIL